MKSYYKLLNLNLGLSLNPSSGSTTENKSKIIHMIQENIIGDNSNVPWTSERKYIFKLDNSEVCEVLSAAFPSVNLEMTDLGTLKNINITKYNIYSKTSLDVLEVVSLNNKSINLMFKATQEATQEDKIKITYHGTNFKNVTGIINRGYSPKYNKREVFGSGIYSAPDIKAALYYSPHQKYEKDNESTLRVIIVNKCIDGKKV